MPQTITNPTLNKPRKPYADFPLFPHATRRWAKKIRGKLHYFGPWSDPQGALQRFLDQRDDLMAGRTPRSQEGGVTVRDLVNRFLTAKRHQVDTREITQRTFDDYFATCERIIGVYGRNRLVTDLASDDFERLKASIAAKWGPVAVGNEVQRVRVVFKYGFDAGLIDRPVRYGPTFKRPSKKVLRRERAAKGPKLFTPEQLRTLLASAGQQVQAMILLAVNCGFGNADVGYLPIRALDLEKGLVDFPRPKTGIDRRCPLWPETVSAIRPVLSSRPEPKDNAHQGLVFITKYGDAWTKETRDNPVSKEFTKLLKANELHRAGLGFYALRHTFATIAGESRDQVAVNHIMGHADASMAAVYRERISDERLQFVVNFVRGWLFGTDGS